MRERSQPLLNQGPISLGYRVGHIQRDSRALRSIIYNKSAVVLHMLRRYIGDEAFFQGLRLFYSDWRFRKAGTDDLERAFQAVTAQPLEKFFDQWIRGFTLPRVRMSWRMEDDGATGVVRIEQLREPFDFPLTVNLQFADGSSRDRTLKVSGAAYEERFPVTSAVRRVAVKDDLSYFDMAR
jgi:aminopeptidase N